MSTVEYAVSAPPGRVLGAITTATTRGSVVGFMLSDRSDAFLIGTVRDDGSFDLRLPRSLSTPPRVALLRGRVRDDAAGSIVAGSFALHPAVKVGCVLPVAFGLLSTVIVVPSVREYPGLLWVPAVVWLTVALFGFPFFWFARYDRAALRVDLEEILRQAGTITRRS